ncbi:MAG TPA: FAD-dependent oxidoreductase [Steroidobacteraceae bacterium]|nr:FAD-dependent oxidoreductase [Steroidobacteraceae bacterium]
MISTILILGGGQAAAQAIDTLRRQGYQGRIVLVGDEPHLPYQRPPLSKKFLAGELDADRLPFKHRPYYEEHRVELELGVAAARIHRAERAVALADGRTLHYDRLLLAVGATSRILTTPGSDLPGVHYLRAIADVGPIRASLKAGARVVVIGGGYIGLETAATARQLGCAVTVLEMADRLMARVVASSVSEYYAHEHRTQGVKVICNTRVVRLEGGPRGLKVSCADGSSYEADVLVVGVGAVPNTALAAEAGLECENGIRVDRWCRTTDEHIFAAGDCTYHPSVHFEMNVRLESVDNAFEQAKSAALNLLGRATVHDRIPWFWSDQYDNKLLIVGLSQGFDQQVLRGDPAQRSFSVCYLKGRELIAVEAVNHSSDYMAARKMIAERVCPNLEKLADPHIPLKEAV